MENLPEDVLFKIFQIYFQKNVLPDLITHYYKNYYRKHVIPCLMHKDWWFHNVMCKEYILQHLLDLLMQNLMYRFTFYMIESVAFFNSGDNF